MRLFIKSFSVRAHSEISHMELLSLSNETLQALERNGGALLKEMCKRGKVTIRINKERVLELDGEGGDVWIAGEVLKALDFGFPHSRAYLLFGEKHFMEILDLNLIFHGNQKQVSRYKGRVIGLGGKSKKTLEELSGAFIAVSGDRIAIIGEFDDLRLAKEAVMRLLEGAMHSGVFGYLEKQQRERKYGNIGRRIS